MVPRRTRVAAVIAEATAAVSFAAVVTVVAQEVPAIDRLPGYGLVGVAVYLTLALFNRWRRQQDDAVVLAERVRAEERHASQVELERAEARYRERLAEIEATHAKEVARLNGDITSLTQAYASLVRVVSRLLDAIDRDLTIEERARIRQESLSVLFPPTGTTTRPDGGH